ncbi:hypothetical protein NKH18_29585 [Streptomyces sp. M10(2022)]
MAKPGYGKRSMSAQLPSRADDFALLPARERCIAGFVDHLPDGAAMDVKSLAKQLPLYGQQAVGSALKALSVAGYLRRVRCLVGEGDQVRWVFRTFWSRTAHDNEWWAPTSSPRAAKRRRPPPHPAALVPTEEPAPATAPPAAPAVPQQRAPEPRPAPAPAAPAPTPGSPRPPTWPWPNSAAPNPACPSPPPTARS